MLVYSVAVMLAQGSILGTVTDMEGMHLEGALVTLDDSQQTVTDNRGFFRFDSVMDGDHEVRVSYVGHEEIVQIVRVEGAQADIAFSLAPNATIEEVLVSSVRVKDNDPFTQTTASKEDLEVRNLGQDVPYLLNHMPSVISSSDAGAGIGYTYMRVRGSDPSKINVTINGIPYNDAESQQTFWVDIPDFTSSAQNIQLVRGVGTSTVGAGAFGASINMLTDVEEEKLGASLASSYGSYNTRKNTLKFHSGKIGENFSLSGRLSDIYSDGYVERAFADMRGYSFQAAYDDDRRYIKALAFGGHEKTYQAWEGLTPAQLKENRRQNPYTYEEEVDDYTQNHYQFHWNEMLSPAWSAKVGLNYTKGFGFFEQYKSDVDHEDYNNIVSSDSTDAVVRRWLKNDFYVGNLSLAYSGSVNVETGVSYNTYLGDHYGEVIWASKFADGGKKGDRYYESDSRKNDMSAFAKASTEIAAGHSLYVDLQGRKVDYRTGGLDSKRKKIAVDTSYIFFNPKLGYTYQMNPTSQIYASYARANREPNRNDFKGGVSQHEVLDNIEAGFRKKGGKFSYAANVYYMYYQNQLVLTGELNDVGAPLRATSGKSYRLGLELEADYRINRYVSVAPNIAISQNKNIDFVDNFNGGLRKLGATDISFSPSIIAGNILKLTPAKGFELALFSKYVGSQYMSNTEAELSKLDAYFTNDIAVYYSFMPDVLAQKVKLKVLFNNITDLEYVDRGYYYTYDDTWSDPNKVTTIEGVGYYPQATLNVLAGIEIFF